MFVLLLQINANNILDQPPLSSVPKLTSDGASWGLQVASWAAVHRRRHRCGTTTKDSGHRLAPEVAACRSGTEIKS